MLLCLDTSSPSVSVAVVDPEAEPGEDVRAEARSPREMKHGEQLAPMVEQVLAEAGISRFDLTAVVVGVGPGPFTGLRVGLVTARTLGEVLDLPVYGLCSLDVLAVEAVDTGVVSGPFTVATDARRKEVHTATYDETGARLSGPDVVKPADAATDGPVVGEGVVLYPESFPQGLAPHRPSAAWLGRVLAGERAEPMDPEPLYLRRPDAEVPGPPKRAS
ncbi:MAG: tRNA (adenosine(37)-N6)-threonylcarbamoyltransferase complex dimerization subunit type 1 TsaB [Nocardioides sp.]|nr:tRNA (adenosine(37)-N6)-threonylcarbamoyltransferase complex dimerization subunit type 1 TsaB [Nocardioides sp.]